MSDENGKPDEMSGELVPQPHGGAIYRGAPPPGKRVAGPGRPPSELIREVRGIFEESLPALEEFALGRRAKKRVVTATAKCECGREVETRTEVEVVSAQNGRDQLKAIEMAGRFGLNVKVDKGLVDEIWGKIEDLVPDDVRPTLKHEINLIVGRRLAEAVVT